ncbi:MAG: aspartate aminotransferase family protein [Phycisphaerales bacterium]|nr:aspartate aminotransferase family protein [Phycisphaerales bacterium]
MADFYADFHGWLQQHAGRQYDLHAEHVNAAFVKMLKTIGFDKGYTRAQGPYLWDKDGNKYLDLLTGWGVFALGRNHPKVRNVMEQVIAKDLPNLVRMDCSLLSGLAAETLTRHASHGLASVFFTNSGTETVEGALKFARCFTKRQKIVYCDHAFHGLTTGSLSINGADFFKERFGEFVPGAVKIPFNDIAALEQALAGKDVAAFIVEPVQGKTCDVVTAEFMREAQRLCKASGALFICDEVQCGLGRTGKWFCFQYFEGIEPDILCVAKALSGGYVPVGAVVTRPEIMKSVFNSMERCVVHSNTFGQNDLAMAAALASLHVIEDEKLVENAAIQGEYVMRRLKEIGQKCPFVSDVRGKGLMFGIDFARPAGGFLLQQKWDALHAMNFGVFGQTIIIPLLQQHRILTQVAGYHTEVIKFLPPMTVTREDMDWFITAMEDVLQATTRTGSTLKTMVKLGMGAVRA